MGKQANKQTKQNNVALELLVKVQAKIDQPGFGGVEHLSLRPKERVLLLKSSGATAGDFA